MTGIGAAIAAVAVAAGVGVAVARNGDGRMDGHTMMSGQMMQMDPAAMREHMKQVLGDETYQKMQDTMKQVLGENSDRHLLDRMMAGCDATAMGSMMQGTTNVPGHDTHHAMSSAVTNSASGGLLKGAES